MAWQEKMGIKIYEKKRLKTRRANWRKMRKKLEK